MFEGVEREIEIPSQSILKANWGEFRESVFDSEPIENIGAEGGI